MDIINFSQSNSRLEIFSKKKLETILPKYFRHAKFESFVRQLNWYGFYKINNKAVNCYSHPDLEKGIKLSAIKSRRKSLTTRAAEERKTESHQPHPLPQPPREGENKTTALFFPFQNPTLYHPSQLENQMMVFHPFHLPTWQKFPTSYQVFFPMKNPVFGLGL